MDTAPWAPGAGEQVPLPTTRAAEGLRARLLPGQNPVQPALHPPHSPPGRKPLCAGAALGPTWTQRSGEGAGRVWVTAAPAGRRLRRASWAGGTERRPGTSWPRAGGCEPPGPALVSGLPTTSSAGKWQRDAPGQRLLRAAGCACRGRAGPGCGAEPTGSPGWAAATGSPTRCPRGPPRRRDALRLSRLCPVPGTPGPHATHQELPSAGHRTSPGTARR